MWSLRVSMFEKEDSMNQTPPPLPPPPPPVLTQQRASRQMTERVVRLM